MRGTGLFVPSRCRPANIARLWQAMQETCREDTTLIVGLDEDDPAKDDYPPGPSYVIRPGLRYVTAWVNALAGKYAGQFEVIGTMGDDNVPETPGWDTRVRAALEDVPFAFADDCYPLRKPGLLACHIFMRPEVHRTLGYFGPPQTRHMYVDVAWTAWGRACGITFLDDVRIPHVHYTTGAPLDETYARSSAPGTSTAAAAGSTPTSRNWAAPRTTMQPWPRSTASSAFPPRGRHDRSPRHP
jgi:hypothetical protein